MIMTIEIILIIAVVITNSPFQPGDFSTGSTSVKITRNLKISTLEFTTTITLNYIWNSNVEEDLSEMTCYF